MTKLPDITQAQIISALGWIVAQAVGMGLIDSTTEKLALQIGASVIALGWMVGDALLRGRRAQAVAANPAAFGK